MATKTATAAPTTVKMDEPLAISFMATRKDGKPMYNMTVNGVDLVGFPSKAGHIFWHPARNQGQKRDFRIGG